MKVSLTTQEPKPRGRPGFYQTPDEMQPIIDEYFDVTCARKPVMDKAGRLYNGNHRRPTVIGLALALGFSDEQSLLDYAKKPAFVGTIARAKSRIKEHLIESTENGEAANGTIWNLRCNFGWKPAVDEPAPETSHTVKIVMGRGKRGD